MTMRTVFDGPDAGERQVLAIRVAHLVRGIQYGAIPGIEDARRRMEEIPEIDQGIKDAMQVVTDQLSQISTMLNNMALQAAREGAEREVREMTGIVVQVEPIAPTEPKAEAQASSDGLATAAPPSGKARRPKPRRHDSRLNGGRTAI